MSELLNSIGIPERIERMLDITITGRDHGNHTNARVLTNKRVSQDLSQSRASKRNMRISPAQRPNALLEGEKRLVDLGALHSRDPVGRRGVLAALAARQVDERDLAVLFARLVVAQDDLEDCVRAR